MKTPLYSYHQKHAKITEFASYEMPLYYTSALQETECVRKKAGLFDVSHMGVIEVLGKDAESFLDYVSTNQIAGKNDNAAIYSPLASKSGGCVDDVMIMRLNKTRFLVVTNAVNKEKVLDHFNDTKTLEKITIVPLFLKSGFLALQGKEASKAIAFLAPDALHLQKHTLSSFFHARFGELIISRTGYTGEDGFEILVQNEFMEDLWQEILLRNKFVAPCGLAARDILRLEMGYALYGHELSEAIGPIESVSHWAVKLAKERFIGKEALAKKALEPHRVEQGVVLQGKGVMREGFNVLKSDRIIGKLTSGGFSPTLNRSIGIALLDEKQPPLQELFIDIRGRKEPVLIEKMPFIHQG